jgi:hypothetical protein
MYQWYTGSRIQYTTLVTLYQALREAFSGYDDNHTDAKLTRRRVRCYRPPAAVFDH